MKKSMLVGIICLFVINSLFSQGVSEQSFVEEKSLTEINFGVLAGPTGMGAVQLSQNDGKISDDIKVNFKVFSSVNDVTAEIIKGDVDVAAISTNLAAILFNKGINIKIAATICDGMMYVLSSEVDTPDQLLGKTISMAGGPVGTPKYLVDTILLAYGYSEDDITYDFGVKSAQQLSSLLMSGKIKNAILTEPFATVVCNKNPNVKKVYNIQEGYKHATGNDNYPMAVLVVNDKFRQNNPKEFQLFMDKYKDSVYYVLENPILAGQMIEDCGIMKKEMAISSIPNCNLTFESETMEGIKSYYERLYEFNSNAIGGSIPTSIFYL